VAEKRRSRNVGEGGEGSRVGWWLPTSSASCSVVGFLRRRTKMVEK